MAAKYLVGVYTVTGGLHEELGSDEQDIVLFSWVMVDLSNTKVVAAQTHVVKPRGTCDMNENALCGNPAAKMELGLSEDRVSAGQPLEQVVEQLDQFVKAKLTPDNGHTFQLVTDGQLHLRQVLHPEACQKEISLPHYYYSFFDIRKEFQNFYHSDEVHSIQDMLSYVGLESDNSTDLSMKQVQNIAKLALRLVADGHIFESPERINAHLEPGICTKHEVVDNNTVVRARGLPWQSSDQDIAKFFRGLNIVKGGVALCLSPQGRRNGEALVRFESQEHRDMALKRHKHHIGPRYIEVYRASGEDFINVAGGNNNEAQAFLSRGGQVIVRMRGLPYDCTPKQVLSFFATGECPCDVMDGEDGVLFVKKADGRATGDAFVLFESEEMASRALQKHREIIGSRYIELFRSTTAEVQQVLNRCMDPRTYEQSQPLITNIPQVPLISPQLLPPGCRKDCIRLRGLPFEAQVEQILEFLGEHSKNIVYQGVHMVYNAQGQPSGEAFIQMDTEHSAYVAAQQRHHRYMTFGKKQRYIEVFQCSVDDMSLVLNGGLPVQRSLLSSAAAAAAGGNMLPPPFGAYPYVQTPQILPAVAPLTPRLPAAAYYSPVFYWPYPSPPVSPTTYYPHSGTTVLTAECIQVQRNGDVRSNSDAMVTFPAARIEAERALQEKTRQSISNRYIELFMA